MQLIPRDIQFLSKFYGCFKHHLSMSLPLDTAQQKFKAMEVMPDTNFSDGPLYQPLAIKFHSFKILVVKGE